MIIELLRLTFLICADSNHSLIQLFALLVKATMDFFDLERDEVLVAMMVFSPVRVIALPIKAFLQNPELPVHARGP